MPAANLDVGDVDPFGTAPVGQSGGLQVEEAGGFLSGDENVILNDRMRLQTTLRGRVLVVFHLASSLSIAASVRGSR